MGKSKKPFVDRKKSSTFHLLHRSQRDVAADVLEQQDHVLWPSEHNLEATNKQVFGSDSLTAWRQQLAAAGLLQQDDPNQFLKPMTGQGTFVSAAGKIESASVTARNATNTNTTMTTGEDAVLEVPRQLDSIPLTADCMEEDIAAALFGDFDEEEYEELNDDFVLNAATEPPVDEQAGDGDGAFNFEEHVRALMEKAKRERQGGDGLPQHHQDNAFFSKLKPLHEGGDDDQDSWDQEFGATPGVVPALSPEEEKALCDKFEQTLAEYDSDEVGDCPEEEIVGPRELEGDAQVEAALDEFMTEQKDDFFMQGNRHLTVKHGGSGFSALVGRRMVHASELDEEANPAEEALPVDQVLAEASQRLALPVVKPPAEDILIDGKSYFSERERNPFDCESILSTYSNLDNNPVTIEASRRRKKKNKNKGLVISEEPVEPIRLSNKTGLPLGVLPTRETGDYDDFDDTIVSVNKGIARNKEETKEEKKARKEQIKRDRQFARIQKKATREVFREEFQKHAVDVSSDDIAGKSVFRYS